MAWARARWGAIRGAVIAVAVVTGVAVALLDPTEPLSVQPAFWVIVGLGAGCAGLVSAARVSAVSVEAIIDTQRPRPRRRPKRPPAPWWQGLDVVASRTGGDAVCVVAVVAVIEAIRVAVALGGSGSGWTAALLHALAMTPVSVFIVFLVAVVVGWLLAVAVGGLIRARELRAAGTGIPAAAWWIFAGLAALALAMIGTIAVGLSDTSAPLEDGGAAIILFLFGPLPLAHPWQYAALWLARLGAYGAVVSAAGLLIARGRARGRS